ncbi:S-ribosylhomocysteine lyase [Oceanispirochaeta sp.]|jgi:S-ribosylhomocysteine lyase|uniref:S-ribosylhomocysteine lyase n=1 Tax=Oceanispirochaeta sp. TaxID=2035350 RepID=UPI0026161D37|nr:S-ribosylhomocysteine lyase [Oceanispirochaeta sp.]MDA3957920.1 S-ribosylhomocysteine lyase [Oceanispirochaeta sp.]
MEKIPSFNIDHIKLLRGIYVSRKDKVGGDTVTTFDIRIKEPNREPVMDNAPLHTLEHLGATYLRSDPDWKDRILYFGPMGCRTGCYLLLKGDLESKDIVELIRKMFRFIADYKNEIPGTVARDCGNYLDHNMDMAAWESRKFLTEVLDVIEESNLIYP